MKRYFLFLCIVIFSLPVFSNLLYDIADGKFRAKQIPALHSMNDGEHYTILTDSATIVKYSYKNKNTADTIFHLPKVKNATIDKISGYEFSPNEELIMVYNSKKYRYRHTFTADYYIYNIRKNEIKVLSEYGRQEAPLFSPNSRYVAFARKNNLFLRKLDFDTEISVTKDGEAGKIINGIPDWAYEEEFGATRYFEWSPDSKMLAYIKFDETKVPEFSFQLYNRNPNEDGITLYPNSLKFKYPKAGDKNSEIKVFVYEDFNKNTREITVNSDDNDFYIPRIRWTKSAEQLAIFKLNRNQNKLDMYLANPKSTVAKLIISEQNKYYIDYNIIDDIYFFDNNNSFLFVSERDGFRHVYKYRMNGILDKQLTSGNWDVTNVYGYDEKNNILYYQSAETSPLQRNIYSLDIRGRKILLSSGKGTHNAIFNSTFTYFIDNASALETPNEVTLRTNKGAEIRVLEDNSDLAQNFKALNLPKKEFFQFETSENIKLNAWIIKPKNFDSTRKYPVLMVQYSGPNSQQVLDRWDIGWEYYLTENGYIVVCVDGRGTGARGTEFRKCTYQQLGVLETKDQIEAAKYLANQSYIDKDRIGIWGWSYGGLMTLLSMSSEEKLFKAGISIAPVTDWRLYNTIYTERFMRRPQENFRGYEVSSPLLQVENLNGKLLIIHGTADDNVHVQNTMLYVEKLVEADKQFEMQIYTDKNHSILGKQTRRHLYTRKCEFLFSNL